MPVKLYNTLTRKKEVFKPIKGEDINMFVCGPTVYDYIHIGNAKTFTQFDFIVRYLRQRGYKVFYLMNITDIDDRIIKRSQEQDKTPQELAKKFELAFYQDMQSLHNTAVTKFARAFDYIPEIVSQVKRLIEKGYAYKIDDGYYFDLKKFKEYGKLSGRTETKEDDGVSRIDENEQKKNKGDFCLWKFSKPGEPVWETEIGKGRPGWHIEDTAITEKFFGPQYDIHGGAMDLIFPHHEAEITQMESISGKKPLVRYWLHTAFLNMKELKMSKSKGNFITARDAVQTYRYDILRFFFISNHYRSPIDFTDKLLEAAKNSLQRINDFVFNIDRDYEDKENKKRIQEFKEKFYRALDDDFNTPEAFAKLFDFIKEQNTAGKSGKNVLAFIQEINTFLDFITLEREEIPEKIMTLATERERARKEKNWKRADELRLQLERAGWHVADTPEGPKVKKKE